MTKVLAASADFQCGHNGTIQILVGTGKLKTQGNEAVTESMLLNAPISGCTNTATPNVPCTLVSSIVSGKATKLNVSGSPAILENVVILTNGSIPNVSVVNDPGQTKLDSV